MQHHVPSEKPYVEKMLVSQLVGSWGRPKGGALRYSVRTRGRWDNGPRTRNRLASMLVAKTVVLGAAVAVVAARGPSRPNGLGCTLHDGGYLVWLEGEERWQGLDDVLRTVDECLRRVVARKRHWRRIERCPDCALDFGSDGYRYEGYVEFYAEQLECPRCWRCSACGYRLPEEDGRVDVELYEIWGGQCPRCARVEKERLEGVTT